MRLPSQHRTRDTVPASASPRTAPRAVALVTSTAIVLALFLNLLRDRWLFWWDELHLHSASMLVRELTVASAPDLAYVALLTAIFLACLRWACGRPRLERWITTLFLLAAVLSLVLAHANVRAVAVLGQPVNYQWLYYSHFLHSFDAYHAVGAQLSEDFIRQTLVRSALLIVLSFALTPGLRWIIRLVGERGPLMAMLVLLAMDFGFAARWQDSTTLDPGQIANPVFSFVASVVNADKLLPLMTLRSSTGTDDFRTVGQRPPSTEWSDAPMLRQARETRVRNVVIVVLESVPASYVGAYGAQYGATPELDHYREQARLFTSMYAHVPSTVHSLVALLLSAYPPLSFRMLTKEYPRIHLPSLSGELKGRRYRTAFFNGAAIRFQHEDVFLAQREFDRVADYRSFPCEKGVYIRTPSFPSLHLTGVRDECLVAAFGDWLGYRHEQPFFAILWTVQTHNPSFVSGPLRRFDVSDSSFNRYLNALHESDLAFGKLMRMLAERGLLESTLVVVVGDHGEAFNQHRAYVHRQLFEEDVHVPFLMMNPTLFHGETDTVVGGLIDVAPTVLHFLGYPLPASWQGRSLFDLNRSGRAYFFTPFSSVLFGYREGHRKFIYDVGGGEPQVYDLFDDPGETENLAPALRGFVAEGRGRLAAWMQFQARFYQDLLVPAAR
jgi:phosphoglycerol transferase MdoB-like AlkP superfamily enzyme